MDHAQTSFIHGGAHSGWTFTYQASSGPSRGENLKNRPGARVTRPAASQSSMKTQPTTSPSTSPPSVFLMKKCSPKYIKLHLFYQTTSLIMNYSNFLNVSLLRNERQFEFDQINWLFWNSRFQETDGLALSPAFLLPA